jgi:hypothetical protein
MKFSILNSFQQPTTLKRNVSAADFRGSLGSHADVNGLEMAWGYERNLTIDSYSAIFHTIACSGNL